MTEYITLRKNATDVTGQRFERLIALGPVGKAHGNIVWLCQCDCGQRTTTTATRLLRGRTRSCGCIHHEQLIERHSTHGLTGHPLHTVWRNIIQRCTDPNSSSYSNYGARGITIHPQWLCDFQNFYNHVTLLPDYNKQGRTLDRIDNDGNYQPGNLRWATRTQQARNRRSLHMETYNGKTQCLAAWEAELNYPRGIISKRLRRGWSIEKAIKVPPGEP